MNVITIGGALEGTRIQSDVDPVVVPKLLGKP